MLWLTLKSNSEKVLGSDMVVDSVELACSSGCVGFLSRPKDMQVRSTGYSKLQFEWLIISVLSLQKIGDLSGGSAPLTQSHAGLAPSPMTALTDKRYK